MKLADDQIAELLDKAEHADSTPLQDGLTIPRRCHAAKTASPSSREATTSHGSNAPKSACREEQSRLSGKARRPPDQATNTGKKPQASPPAPQRRPPPKDQYNFTDPESRIMKVRGGFEQSYNAQAAVEVQSMLIVGRHVTDAPTTNNNSSPPSPSSAPSAGQVGNVLVDSGYYSANAAVTAGGNRRRHRKFYAAIKRQSHGRSIDRARSDATTRHRRRRGPRSPSAWPTGSTTSRQRALRPAQTNRRTRLRHHQGSHRLPALPAARPRQSRPRMDPGGPPTTSSASITSANPSNPRWPEVPERSNDHLAAPVNSREALPGPNRKTHDLT